ncbi:hypothetical protein BCV69DRAFT_277079 [Microstroma glucosiphilum]|uniref:Myp1 protein n=1 Tax=Pseudomicrostroma glucosiphilum TaxID=1684307 RepID=A0A316UD05_9BASI|nr:hypothetical protein BCV69DRAFT_277079 [Pseudomicrostroma glucosiphilum]PWN20925.1 hypothetical protein BCV69DRAFT_277079 [Pseudomicrostroma glucosiphilum]
MVATGTVGPHRPRPHARSSSHGSSSSAAGPSYSRSAPVSPSTSFASLTALRNSLAMRSGDLGLEESAHTFPVDEETSNDQRSSNASMPSTSNTAARTSMSTAPQNNLRGSFSLSRSSSAQAASSSGPVPPPLSMHNLPPPRMSLSAHPDRRISPFHEGRGMSFTPAASPPLNLSPTVPMGYFEQDMQSSSRRTLPPGGSNRPRSANPSRSSSPNGSVLSFGRSDHSRRQQSNRPRSRTISDATAGVMPMRRINSRQRQLSAEQSSGNVAPPAEAINIRMPRIYRRASSAAGSSGGFPESDASDTGEEGDADDVPQRPVRVRPARTRSSSQVSSTGLSESYSHSGYRNRAEVGYPAMSTRRPGFATTGGGSSPRGSWYSRSPTIEFSSGNHSAGNGGGSSFLDLASAGIDDFSTAAGQLWQLHQAALGYSTMAGLGVDMLADHSHASPNAHADAMAPPPPYQANDDVDHIQMTRHLVNQLEREQAEASLGRRLGDSQDGTPQGWGTPATERDGESGAQGGEGLSFRSMPHRRREDRRVSNGSAVPARQASLVASAASPAQPNGSLALSATSDVLANAAVDAGDPQSPDVPDASPPAWQPKSDTEGDTDTNEGDRRAIGEPADGALTSPDASSQVFANQRSPQDRNQPLLRQSLRGRLAACPLVRQMAEEEDYSGPSPWVLRYLLHPLRLLAAVPGCVGTFWLIRNAVVHMQTSGSLFVRGPLDVDQPHMSNPWRMTRALDFLLASLWAISTAYHALSLTTLLLRRWLIYYSLLPSLIRLLALQAICWPLVRMTIFIAGPDRPIEAWVVIASTTAFSDVVARWVTSNIADAPTKRTVQRRSQPPTTTNGGRVGRRSRSRSGVGAGNTTTSLPAGQENGAPTTTSSRSSSRERGAERPSQQRRRQPNSSTATFSSSHSASSVGRARTGQRFWRAVMGAPIDSSTSDSDGSAKSDDDEDEVRALHASALDAAANRPSRLASLFFRGGRGRTAGTGGTTEGTATETDDFDRDHQGHTVLTETDLEFEGEGETTDAGATTTALLDEDDEAETAEEALHRLRVALRRRRRHRMRLKLAALQGGLSPGSGSGGGGGGGGASYRSNSSVPSLWSTRATETAASGGADGAGGVKVRSRRVFHWEVAMKRNVAPIGVLAYLTLWGMLIGAQ